MAIVSPYDEKWETVLFFSPQLQSWIEHLINMQTSIHIQEQNELWPSVPYPSLGHKEINIVVKESAPLPHSEPLLTVPTYCYLKYPISCFE